MAPLGRVYWSIGAKNPVGTEYNIGRLEWVVEFNNEDFYDDKLEIWVSVLVGKVQKSYPRQDIV
jgi:hypothetical protein